MKVSLVLNKVAGGGGYFEIFDIKCSINSLLG